MKDFHCGTAAALCMPVQTFERLLYCACLRKCLKASLLHFTYFVVDYIIAGSHYFSSS